MKLSHHPFPSLLYLPVPFIQFPKIQTTRFFKKFSLLAFFIHGHHHLVLKEILAY